MITYQIDTDELNKGLKLLADKLGNAVKEDVIRKALSKGSIFMAQWSANNRIANLNPNRKQVLSDKLTARSALGYKTRIFGQAPSDVTHSGNEYIAKFGTNITNRGFSYPRLHEFGGRFHPARPVLTPAIEDKTNKQKVLDLLTEGISKALEAK